MAEIVNASELVEGIEKCLARGWSHERIFEHLSEKGGYTNEEIFSLFMQSSAGEFTKKSKNEETIMNQKVKSSNPIEDILSALLAMGIKYGLPLLLIMFGVTYVGNEIARDLPVGIRSAAAAIMPLAVTLALAKSNIRHSAVDFFNDNKLVAFGFAFALAMIASAAAMWMREFNNVIPVGELAFSTTLSLMIFGNNDDGDVSFVHVGAVTGLLTYVILFGVAL